MLKAGPELFGVNNVSNPTNKGAELVSHFHEIAKTTQGNQIYMPISDGAIKLSRIEYIGKLYDALYFNTDLEIITKKMEFKFRFIKPFGHKKLGVLESAYSKLGRR